MFPIPFQGQQHRISFLSLPYIKQQNDSGSNEEYKANKKLSAMSAANPEAPTDFIVDSNFPGISSVLTDVIPEMINSVAFGKSSVDEALEKAQNSADKIVEKYNK